MPPPTPTPPGPGGASPSEISELARILRAAADRHRKIILNPPGASKTSKEFYRARSAALLQQIELVAARAKIDAGAWVKQQVPAAYRTGLTDAETQIREQLKRVPKDLPLRGGFSVADEHTLRVLALDTAMDLNKAIDSMAAGAKSVLRQVAAKGLSVQNLNDIIAKGVIDGTPREAIRELRQELVRVSNGQIVQVINKNGGTMNFDAGYYAELVVRTRTREATETARHQRLRENDITHVAITGRVSENFCTAFLGQIYYIGNGNDPAGYPEMPLGGPPFHPNCSKSTRAVVLELADPEQLAAGKPDPDVAAVAAASNPQRAYKDLQLRPAVTQRYGTISPINGPKRQTAEGDG